MEIINHRTIFLWITTEIGNIGLWLNLGLGYLPVNLKPMLFNINY